MPERPSNSRFRRLPGLYRFGDVRAPDPHAEPQLLSLYLPGRLLDQAEALAMRNGSVTVQEYCEKLLSRAIEAEESQVRAESIEVRHEVMESLEAMTNEPDYLASLARPAPDEPEPEPELVIVPCPTAAVATTPIPENLREIVLRNAGMAEGNAPWSLISCLRRGESVPLEVSDELLLSLSGLEAELRGAKGLDRRLAYALHRLAFESQVLLTDSPTQAAADPATIEAVRRVQEAVDRVLSDEDIRYDLDPPPSEPSR